MTKALLRYALRTINTKMMIIIGHLRSGKSSLFETLTGLEGHSANGVESGKKTLARHILYFANMLTKHPRRKVTREYHLGRAFINKEFYLIVDTPGLNDTGGNNADILREIARLLKTTRDAVTYAGILAFAALTIRHLSYFTTLWDECSRRAVVRHDENIQEIIANKWSRFITKGASVYHHGRTYDGESLTFETLDIEDDKDIRQKNAQEMIARVFPPGREYKFPLIVQELRANIPLEATQAGRYLQMTYEQVLITNALRHGADYAARIEAPGPTPSGEEPETTGGFSWVNAIMSAIIDVVTFPFKLVLGPLYLLWDLIQILRKLISIVSAIPYRLTNNGVEVLITLLGNYRVIVGYGLDNGFYWRAWSESADDELDDPNNEILNQVLSELREDPGDTGYSSDYDFDGSTTPQLSDSDANFDRDQQYRDFADAFDRARSTQEESTERE
ncbi:hypothetical protein BJY01DRAFT_253682 [Aspergillus pseudoustus]|uniref:G domain-containing protein n=1 Tax=Aspergillus pseudoustus TaxID=1810923 RepID=A0ABR4IZ55_9EURO